MKLTVFQSDKGDCLLLAGADGRMVLVDGGMRDSYSRHVAPALGKLRDDGKTIDVVYVSHIDQDHISGVLQMMDDEVDWRIHEYAVASGNTHKKPPEAPRPPKVKAIWHNAFREQVKDNKGEIADMLAASSVILSGSENAEVKELASEQGELVTSIAEAIQLSRRVSPDQLGIDLNPPAGGKLMMVRDAPGSPIAIGGMRCSIIGPFEADLSALRDDWDTWLKENKKRLKSIRKQAEEDSAKFSVREIGEIILPKLRQAEELSGLLPLATKPVKKKLGQRKKVTVPNLASLMLFVQEKGKTLLLTGDGHHEDVLKGLKHIGKLNGSGGIHVDVLKVQHHASEHNLDEAFCRAVTADHYLFCGNGEHENPDLDVVRAIADSRLSADPAVRSPNPQAGDPFKLWFNSSAKATIKEGAKEHMGKIRSAVRKRAKASKGQMRYFFLEGSSFEVQI